MRQMTAILALCGAFMAPAAHAADDTCDKLLKGYEYGSKLQSRYSALAIIGRITQASADSLQTSTVLIRQINLTLMIENKCPVPKEPALLNEYRSDAARCAAAISNNEGVNPTVCSMDTWVNER